MDPLLDRLIIEPRVAHGGSVVWLHGLGASCHDFEPVVPMMGRSDLRFVLPNAPSRPVTINGGYVMPAWYDIKTMGDGPGREDPAHIAEAQAQIEALIAAEVADGVPPDRIVLLGFSQGAAVALHTGLRQPSRLAGIGVLSGYLVQEDRLAAEAHPANTRTPVLHCHGTVDDVVPVARGRRAHARTGSDGHAVEWHEWQMGHSVCQEEIEVIARWLGEVLPPR